MSTGVAVGVNEPACESSLHEELTSSDFTSPLETASCRPLCETPLVLAPLSWCPAPGLQARPPRAVRCCHWQCCRCPEDGCALRVVCPGLCGAAPHTGLGVSPPPPGSSAAWDSLVWMDRVQALRLHAGVESSDSTMSLNAPQQETDKLGGRLPLQPGGILDASV